MEFDDLIEPLGEGLKQALRDVVTDATDPELTKFTLAVAARSIDIAKMPDGPDKDELLEEHKGTFDVIAEEHRINLAEKANAQLTAALDVGLAIVTRLAASA